MVLRAETAGPVKCFTEAAFGRYGDGTLFNALCAILLKFYNLLSFI